LGLLSHDEDVSSDSDDTDEDYDSDDEVGNGESFDFVGEEINDKRGNPKFQVEADDQVEVYMTDVTSESGGEGKLFRFTVDKAVKKITHGRRPKEDVGIVEKAPRRHAVLCCCCPHGPTEPVTEIIDEVVVRHVVQGFNDAVRNMHLGEKRTIQFPAESEGPAERQKYEVEVKRIKGNQTGQVWKVFHQHEVEEEEDTQVTTKHLGMLKSTKSKVFNDWGVSSMRAATQYRRKGTDTSGG
jgi:hypothetical protein